MKRFALFANFENPMGDTRRALLESVHTVCHAEALGYEEVWLTEHHFNPFSVSAALFSLLSYLAARTRSIGLGAGALLLPFHEPFRVAEEIATLDALSGGRLLLGIGRGGPFPEQFRHFGVSHDESRARMFEGMAVLEKLLEGTQVRYQGTFHHYEDLSVYPRPMRPGLPPIWLASMSDAGVELAARRGYGLMAPSAAPASRIAAVMERWRALGGNPERPLVLARYLSCHEDGRRAREDAMPFIRDFGSNMRAAIKGIASAAPVQPFSQPESAFAEAQILANAIVGDPAACVEQCLALKEAVGDCVLLLKPASYDPEINRRSLTLFAEQVRPRLTS